MPPLNILLHPSGSSGSSTSSNDVIEPFVSVSTVPILLNDSTEAGSSTGLGTKASRGGRSRTKLPACHRCRKNKTACPKEKPSCGPCQRGGHDCVYPSKSAVRGKDKTPGGRIKNRVVSVAPVARAGSAPQSSNRSTATARHKDSPMPESTAENAQPAHIIQPRPLSIATSATDSSRPVRVNLEDVHHERATSLPRYATPGDVPAAADAYWKWMLEKNGSDRRQATARIVRAVNSFFTNSHVWLNFLHRGLFFRHFLTPSQTLRGSPLVIMAILAHVTLMQDGSTPAGQLQAKRYAEEADSLITYHQTAGSLDPSALAAALILVMFEYQPHVNHSMVRVSLALQRLNAVGLSLFANRLDADDPRVSTTFTGLPRTATLTATLPTVLGPFAVEPNLQRWATVPPWSELWSENEGRKEEMRRMCWTAMAMSASFSLWRYMRGTSLKGLDMNHPELFRLLFPGEAVYQESAEAEQGKATPWALYQRMVNLWLYMDNRRRADRPLSSAERIAVLAELDVVEQSLELLSTTDLTNYVWQARDWVMVIRRSLGAFDAYHIRKWFATQLSVMRAFANPPPGKPKITDRPIYCWWYMMQAYSALELAALDRDYWTDADAVYHLCLAALKALRDAWNTYPLKLFVESVQYRYKSHIEARYEMGDTKSDPSSATLRGAIRLLEVREESTLTENAIF